MRLTAEQVIEGLREMCSRACDDGIAEIERLRAELSACREGRVRLKMGELRAERDALRDAAQTVANKLAVCEAENIKLRAERDELALRLANNIGQALSANYEAEKLNATIDQLRAERDAAVQMCDRYVEENQRISDERDALREDAERYRWLRDNDVPVYECVTQIGPDPNGAVRHDGWLTGRHSIHHRPFKTMDAAIDEARREA